MLCEIQVGKIEYYHFAGRGTCESYYYYLHHATYMFILLSTKQHQTTHL